MHANYLVARHNGWRFVMSASCETASELIGWNFNPWTPPFYADVRGQTNGLADSNGGLNPINSISCWLNNTFLLSKTKCQWNFDYRLSPDVHINVLFDAFVGIHQVTDLRQLPKVSRVFKIKLIKTNSYCQLTANFRWNIQVRWVLKCRGRADKSTKFKLWCFWSALHAGFIIISQLRWPFELTFSQVCYFVMLRSTKWEDWPLTITISVHCL